MQPPDDPLAEVLWAIDAEPTLSGFAQIASTVIELLTSRYRSEIEARIGKSVEGWLSELQWAFSSTGSLSQQLFEERTSRVRFLRTAEKNPVVHIAAVRHGAYCMLWERHANSALNERLRALQAGTMFASISLMRSRVSQEKWSGGQDCDMQLSSDLYAASLAIRRFATSGSHAHVLVRIHPTISIDRFSNHLDALADSLAVDQPKEKRIAGDLRTIANIIRWGISPSQYGVKHERRSVTSSVRSVLEQDEATPNVDTVSRQIDSEAEQGALGCGDFPPDVVDQTRVVLTSRGGSRIRLASGWREMRDQLLPWRWDELAVEEIAEGFTPLRERAKAGERDGLELFAAANMMLWMGQDFWTSVSVSINDIPQPSRYKNLVLSKPGAEDPVWLIHALKPSYAERLSTMLPGARPIVEWIPLPDYAQASRPLLTLMDIGAVFTPPGEQVALFREPLMLEDKLKEYFRSVDPRGRLDIRRLGKTLFHRIVRRSREIVAACLITGHDHDLASSRSFYSSFRVSWLREIYKDAVVSLSEDLTRIGYECSLRIPAMESDSSDSVGSHLCPELRTVKTAVEKLTRRIHYRWRSDRIFRGDENYEFFNLYAFYTSLWFSFAIGSRGFKRSYVAPDGIDTESGVATMADKSNAAGDKARLLWIPPQLQRQMVFYEALRREFDVLRDWSGPEMSGIYFLSAHARVPLDKSSLTPYHDQYLPFPVNVARHFMRTELIERGMGPEWVDFWMGHWFEGEEPWGRYSSLNPTEYISALRHFLVPLLDEIGFVPIECKLRIEESSIVRFSLRPRRSPIDQTPA